MNEQKMNDALDEVGFLKRVGGFRREDLKEIAEAFEVSLQELEKELEYE